MFLQRPRFWGALLLMFAGSWGCSSDDSKDEAGEPCENNYGFVAKVGTTCTETHAVVTSDGVPTEEGTGTFPNSENPNSIGAQDDEYFLPLEPQQNPDGTTTTPMGPIGIALNGVTFFNPLNALNEDAVEVEVFDDCNGHPDMMSRYHYHQSPVCIFEDTAGNHSPLIGYLFDGFALYGPQDEEGASPDLDYCNGHVGSVPGGSEEVYHYHVTSILPYLVGCYYGVVEEDNLEQPGGGGGPPGP